jgi:LPS-assembly protein
MMVSTPSGEVSVIADRLEEVGPERLLVATGNVEVTRGTSRLTADRIEINRESGETVATGHAIFYDGDDRLTGSRIDYNFRTGTGVVYEAETRTSPYYRLNADRLDRLGESVYHVVRGVFTTCDTDPPTWSFRIGSGTVDLENRVVGQNASFWVRRAPLIPWIPFFAATVRQDRETGFLFPTVGTSSTKGFFGELPFFWAISDSQDLTVSVLDYQKRGFGGRAEYRYYLSRESSGDVRGFLLHETTPSATGAAATPAERGWGGIRHIWAITPELSFKADIRGVTDNTVLADYGDRIQQISEQRMESNVFLTRNWKTWAATGSLFWYQDLTTTRPVELDRLPEVTILGVRQPIPGLPGFLYEFEGDAVKFVRLLGSDGDRLDVRPRVSRPVSMGGFLTVTPFAGGRLTAYDRRVTGTHVSPRDGRTLESTETTLQVRRLAELGTDVETIASRPYDLGGFVGLDGVLHSIEPRLNYTWVGGDGSQKLPQWTDLDRPQEASLIQYSLTNRLQARTVTLPGTEPVRFEMMRLVIGNSIDLRARRRQLGDVTGDLILQPTERMTFRSTVRYDVHGAGLQDFNTELALLLLPRFSGSLGTRTSPPTKVDYVVATVRAELTKNFIGTVTTNWDRQTNTIVENRFGVNFRFQCWAFLLEYVQRPTGLRLSSDEVRFTLGLLGMGTPLTSAFGLGALTSSGGSSSR